MVSTYLSYDLVNRDMSKTMQRVASDGQVSREAQYYADNIGKVTTIDEFMDDYRLFSYAMKAHGLEEMTYAKAFMKQVLESDLNDESSFASRVADDRYRDFAAAFNFSTTDSTATAQAEFQVDEIIGLYNQNIDASSDVAAEETRYYNAMMKTVDNVNDILRNDRLRDYVFSAFGLDGSTYSYEIVKKAMTSDPADAAGYTQTVLQPQMARLETDLAEARAKLAAGNLGASETATLKTKITAYQNSIDTTQTLIDLGGAFEFATDGTVARGGAQTADKQQGVVDLYLLNQPRVTQASAVRERDYFAEKIGTVTSVDDILDDARLYNYVRVAFNMNEITVVKSTIEQILVSDLSDPNSYANRYAAERPQYLELAKAFNFATDGTVAAGGAQTAEQTKLSASNYITRYDDLQVEADEAAIALYKSDISGITSIADFLKEDNVYQFALKAMGIDPDEVSQLTIKNVLRSDLSDPKSYVYGLKDERFVKLAQAFNFNADGDVKTPVMAQSPDTLRDTASSYIIQMTRFLEGDAKTTAREAADAEASYYTDTMQSIRSASEFLADRRLVDLVLTAKGIDPVTVTDDFLEQMFTSDLDDPESFINQQADSRFAELLGTFNFDKDGNLLFNAPTAVQSRGEMLETQNLYLRQTLEEQEGNENAGVRLALYFERMAASVTDAYEIIGDEALLEFFRITFSMPEELSNMDVDQQAKLVEQNLNLQDLTDPEKLAKLIQRFTVLYDLETGDTGSSALSVLNGSGSLGITADMLLSISRYR